MGDDPVWSDRELTDVAMSIILNYGSEEQEPATEMGWQFAAAWLRHFGPKAEEQT